MWLRKWAGSYDNSEKSSNNEWFRDESRAPKNVRRKTDSELEQIWKEKPKIQSIVALELRKYNFGCMNSVIRKMKPQVCQRSNVSSKGMVWWFKRGNAISGADPRSDTPFPNPTKANDVHQMDFVGPRHIKGYGAISSLHLIDVAFNRAYIQQYAGRSMNNVIEFLLGCWTENAIPNYLQMDNGAYFIGGLIHPRHFSRVVRLCLYLGVEPVFIAPRKPWMNGTIEGFNGEFGDKLWE